MNRTLVVALALAPLAALARPRPGGAPRETLRLPVPFATLGSRLPTVSSQGEGAGRSARPHGGDSNDTVTRVEPDGIELGDGSTLVGARAEGTLALQPGDAVRVSLDPATGRRTVALRGRATITEGPAGRAEGVVTEVDLKRSTLTLSGAAGELSFSASPRELRRLRRGERIQLSYERVAEADVASNIRRLPAAQGRPPPRR